MKREHLFIDNNGRSFFTYRDGLPGRASNFPQQPPIRDRDAMQEFRQLDIAQFCWGCGRHVSEVKLDLHHIMGGSERSDERTNFSMLCGGFTLNACHPQANTDGVPMGLVLARKWAIDPLGTDWRRLAIIRGRFLPDLMMTRDTLSPSAIDTSWGFMLSGAMKSVGRVDFSCMHDRVYNVCEWYHVEQKLFDAGEDVTPNGLT